MGMHCIDFAAQKTTHDLPNFAMAFFIQSNSGTIMKQRTQNNLFTAIKSLFTGFFSIKKTCIIQMIINFYANIIAFASY